MQEKSELRFKQQPPISAADFTYGAVGSWKAPGRRHIPNAADVVVLVEYTHRDSSELNSDSVLNQHEAIEAEFAFELLRFI